MRLRARLDAAFDRWGRTVHRHPLRVLFSMLLFAALFISQAPKITMDTSIEGFLLDDDPTLVEYNDFRDRFDRDDRVVIAIRTPEIFDFAFLEKLRALHEEIERDTLHVAEVDSLINARSTRGVEGELIVEDLFEDWPTDEAALALIEARALANPIYRDLILSANLRYTAIMIRLDTYADASDELDLAEFEDETEGPDVTGAVASRPFLSGAQTIEAVDSLRSIVTRYGGPDFEVHLAGAPVIVTQLMRKMSADIRFFLLLSIVVAAGSLFLLFRRVAGTLIPVGVVLLSLATTIGCAALLGIPIQVPTQILPAFLIAVGIGDSVHILAMFYHELRHGASKEDALAGALRHSGLAVLMTSVTTAGALSSFASAALAPIHNLGIIAPIGVMLALLYTMTLLPALLTLVETTPPAREARRLRFIDGVLRSCAKISTTRPKTVVAASALMVLVALVGVSRLGFSHNPVAWFPRDDEVRTALEVMNGDFRGVITFEVLFETGRENALYEPELLATLEALQTQMQSFERGEIYIGKTLSIVDILEEIHQALNGGQPEFRKLPGDRELAAQELLLFENSGSDDLQDVTDSLFSTARMTLRTPWEDALAFAPVVRHIESTFREAVGDDVDITVTGMTPLLARTFEAVVHSLASSYLLAFIVITPLMMTIVGSIRLGLLSMIPNLAPILLTLGIMGALKLPLDGFTLLIGSIALGLAVDDTIHFMSSFRRYFEESGDATRAVYQTLETSGQAMLVTTLVLCASFFIFTLGYMNNTSNFGLLTGLALLLAFIGDVLLAPALMVLVTRRRAGPGWPEENESAADPTPPHPAS